MITGQQIVNDCRSTVIEPLPAFFSDARMLALINKGQNSYVRLTKVLEAKAYSQTISDQASYSLPEDFLSSLKVSFNNQQGGTDAWRSLACYSIEKMSQEVPNFLSVDTNPNQMPDRFFILEKQIYLYPTPTVAVANNLAMFYERMPAALNTLADPLSIDDSLVEGIVAYVLWQLFEQDNEDAKAAKWEDRWEKELGRGRTWKRQRTLDSRASVDVESPWPTTYGGFNPLNLF